ncbi:ATP-binding protein [Phenylobacterium sp. LjRoot225]|uniref:ATP-binding protein n=1 Tax=Phenylobacterium sp. LjRoot225 TaxID=3342285 RepID=UPI003ED15317
MRDVQLAPDRLVLTLDNDIEEIAAALPNLQAFGEGAQLGPRLQNRFEVIFEELASNVIRHGFVQGSRQQVRICAAVDAQALTLVVEDDGLPFDPLARAAPAPLTDLASAPEGGLGIALVTRLASRLCYEAPQGGADQGFRPVNRVTAVLLR